MNSKPIVFIILVISCLSVFFYLMRTPTQTKNTISFESHEKMIEHAINITLAPTHKEFSQEAYNIRRQAFKKIEEADYAASLAIIINALENFPRDFGLQADLATLLGDYSEIAPDQLKNRMTERSKEIFAKLLPEVEGQTAQYYYSFKNEYYYRFGLYKEQYENGLQRVEENWDTTDWEFIGIKGYYGQGVGAANYARELLKQGNKSLALEYAQKALVAWAQFFSYDNSYYNAYVHFALALGILGYKDDMMKALQHSANIIKKDLSYVEFKEVIDFVNGIH